MKNTMKILVQIMVIGLVFAACGDGNDNNNGNINGNGDKTDPVSVSGVGLDKTTMTLFVNHGETTTLTASVSPENATNKAVSFSSSDTSKATVDANGKVTPIAAGNVTITVTTADGNKTASCAVTVKKSVIDMVSIQAGTFLMGSPESETEVLNNSWYDNERPQRQVTLSKFFMGKYLVTQAQYEEVMGMNPSYFKDSYLPAGLTTGDNLPVERVRWFEAIIFCNKLSVLDGLNPAYSIEGKTDPAQWGEIPTSTGHKNYTIWNVAEIIASSNGYRLPTEAQWEYACRAGTTTAFNWGTNLITSDQANYYASYVDPFNTVAGVYLGSTSEVGRYAPNAWGLYDMHGNLYEWCWDWYDEYPDMAQTDPSGAVSGDYRVVRGGGWGWDDGRGQYLRSAFRSCLYPSDRYDVFGFRVVRP